MVTPFSRSLVKPPSPYKFLSLNRFLQTLLMTDIYTCVGTHIIFTHTLRKNYFSNQGTHTRNPNCRHKGVQQQYHLPANGNQK